MVKEVETRAEKDIVTFVLRRNPHGSRKIQGERFTETWVANGKPIIKEDYRVDHWEASEMHERAYSVAFNFLIDHRQAPREITVYRETEGKPSKHKYDFTW